jgi:hypothetical protein
MSHDDQLDEAEADVEAMEDELQFIDLLQCAIGGEALSLVPRALAAKYRCIPLSLCGDDTLFVAMSLPSDGHAAEVIERYTGYTVEPVQAEDAAIEDAIRRHYDPGQLQAN